jgi:chorismate dehydratase
MKTKLRIGKISFTNLFPFFYTLQKEFDCSDYEFIEGPPSELNNRIRSGEIDVSPSSSIEFLRHPELYSVIENHSISSAGPVGSILLFSKKPFETLSGSTVLTSSQSETSVALLQIMAKKFYNVDCNFQPTSDPPQKALQSYTAYMLIGDEALIESRRWPDLYTYDLGDLWHKKTGLPFTFALWIARNDSSNEKSELLERFRNNLDSAKMAALAKLDSIAPFSPLRDRLTAEELVSYWRSISYDFTERHKEGLDLFRKYAEELGLL